MQISRTIGLLAGILLVMFGTFRFTRVLSSAVPADHRRYHLAAAIGALSAGGSRFVPEVADAPFFLLIAGVGLFLWGSTRAREAENRDRGIAIHQSTNQVPRRFQWVNIG